MGQQVAEPRTSLVEGQFEVKDQTLPEVLFALMRALGVLFTGAVGILGFLKAKDIAGLIAFVKSSDLLPAFSSVVALGTVAYGAFKTWQRQRKLITAAHSADDSVAVVVKPGT